MIKSDKMSHESAHYYGIMEFNWEKISTHGGNEDICRDEYCKK